LAGRRGTALLEFVWITPLLALVLGLTFFFGWSMMNKQRVKMAGRYVTWRRVHGWTGEQGEPNSVNEMFFWERGRGIDIRRGSGPDATLEDYVDSVAMVGAEAAILAEDAALDRWPRGRSTRLGAAFATDVGFYQRFEGALWTGCAREGVGWRRGQASYGRSVRELYLRDLDASLEAVAAPGTGLAGEIQHLYTGGW
jgi:hypothetical protein